MEKSTLTEDKAEKTPAGGVLVGKREGQTIIHNKGSLSGYLVGRTHAEGGIKAVNKSTGQPLEVQGGEVVITAPAVADQTKREFEGKMMTNREILSAINEKGGGVAFAKGGDIPKNIKRTGASYKYGGKTMTDHEIYKYITGGHLAEGYSLREIASIHQVPLSELKEQVRMGMKAESEHTPSKREQMKIVKDHLFENPKYYTLLKKAGLENGGKIGEFIIGKEYTGNQVRKIVSKYGSQEGTDMEEFAKENIDLKDNYVFDKISILKLLDYDIDLKSFIDDEFDKSKKYKYQKVDDLNNPILLGDNQYNQTKNVVLDGYHRILQKLQNGEDDIFVLVKKSGLKHGGRVHRESLVRDAKSGNTPARDLNNYNDVLDIDADGMVGAETGLYADGGMMKKGGLIAPNGKTSNLTPEQYKLVRTPEFKEWFGDWENDPENASKVVDENGEPMVVYHTTSAEFNIFSKKKSKEGFFFAPQKERLSVYNKSNINSYFLNLRNPSHEMFKSDLNYLIPKGYDGIMDYGHAKHLGNKNLYEIIAFEPEQIKLADGTNTKFDNMNPDIRYADGGDIEDLFENYDKQPKELTKIVDFYMDKYNEGDYDYEDSQDFLKQVEAIGYTFDFGLDNEPYNLRPISNFATGGKMDKARYRIIDSNGRIKYTGTEMGSWFTLDKAKELVNYSNGEMIYEYDNNGDRLWEVFQDGGDVKPYDANMEGDSADMIFAEGGAVSPVVNNWNEVPSIWKDTKKVKKVAFTNSPYDKGLYSIISSFLGKDDLRPILTGINFDENGITVTDAHKLISLPYPNKQFEGVYYSDLSKYKETEQTTIDGKYPNYVAIIPESKNTVKYEVDVYKLLQYTNVAIKYANQTTFAVNFKIYDEVMGFNGKFLIELLTTFLKLGYDKVYGHFVGYTKAFVFSPNKNYELGNDDLMLIMPLMVDEKFLGAKDMVYGTNRKLSVYYDFNDNEIHNADGSIAEFKMNYASNSVLSPNDVNLLQKLANGRNKMPILDYVKVEDGVARASDLDSEYYLKGVDLPNGIYKTNKGALEITMEAMDDYPRSPIFVSDEDTLEFTINSDVFEYYVDKFQNVVGKDELRPVMQGICLHHTSDNKLFLAGTDANILLKVNITEYVDMPEVFKDMKFIIQPKRLYDFLNSTEHTTLRIKCNLVATTIESDSWSFYARNIDGNFPNYEAVIPREATKLVSVGIEPIKKAFNSEPIKTYIKETDKKLDLIIFNKEDEIFIAKSEGRYGANPFEVKDVEKLCETNVDFTLKDYYNDNKNVLLIMPFIFGSQTNFSFRKDLLERVFKVVNTNKLDLHYNEINRAYLIPIDTFDFKATTKEHKVKEQKPSVAEVKLVSTINEVSEIKEAIETLEMLLETATRKDKKEIKEAIEVLQMLLDTYEY